MSDTTFVSGTVIASSWLNDVNDFIYEKVVHVSQYGAVGDGITDDYPAIAAAMAVAVSRGVELYFDGTKTYSINILNWTITSGSRFRTNGAEFICPYTTTSNTVWLSVDSNCRIDELNITIPTGIRRDRCLSIGADCVVGQIKVVSTDVQLTEDSDDFGVRLNGDNTSVGVIYVTNYDRAVIVRQAADCHITGVQITGYVRGLYILESPGLYVGKSHIQTASVNALYDAGHNGVIVSCDVAGESHDITLEDFFVEDAGEHGIRIGGELTQQNIWIVRPNVARPGGSGIKVLGTDAVTPTDRNGTIFLVDPVCEDVGANGALASNKCGILIMHADRVRVTNPVVRSVTHTSSSYACLRVVATADLSVVNPYFEDAEIDGIWLDGSEAGDDNDRFTVIGGICRGNGQDGLRIACGANTVRRFNIDGLALDSNARYGFNIAIGGAGSLTDSVLKVKTFSNTSGAGACDTAAVFMDVFGLPGSTPISGITAGNGSTWHDQTTLNYRKAGSWVAL